MAITFDGPVLVPVADPNDAERTARAVAARLEPPVTAFVVHVIEKGGGAPDKAPLEARREYAAESFGRARGPLEAAGLTVETEILYGTDVVETILDAATDHGVDGVVFVPRTGGRLTKLLTGDVTRRLVETASVPVVSLPRADASEDED
ncbi:universal stress protein [Salinilacihabitans rarus]|uniref:universal stress protein n=1 Tax=Salinilacihabitans rarus TaxID=2961596 RepID=UPI0020C87C04|nr:universal stress protein [Salinilacihabitans rarus]